MATASDGTASEDVEARIAIRALWPPKTSGYSANTSRPLPPSDEQLKVMFSPGTRVVVEEDFKSDSGAQDKVHLKCGQKGVVKKTIPTGHACIDFEAHKKQQWVAKDNLRKLRVQGDAEQADRHLSDRGEELGVDSSGFRQQVLEQLNDALDAGFARRLARLEKKIQLLHQTGSEVGPSPETLAGSTQLHRSATDVHAPTSLSKALARALRTRPRKKRYGPSGVQASLTDPPEKDEQIVPESTTLRLTLQSLEQNVASRRRQVASLTEQVAFCQETCSSIESQAKIATSSEKTLLEDSSLLEKTHRDGITRRRTRVQELAADAAKVERQAKRLQILSRGQHRYLFQHERISMMGGAESLTRHAAGDVFLAPRPLPFDEEAPASVDVANSVANPYNVDSWPFEPNVLARRTFSQEVPMIPFKEETEEDLEEERRRLPNPFLPGLNLPRREDSDDDSAEDCAGPTATSRSL